MLTGGTFKPLDKWGDEDEDVTPLHRAAQGGHVEVVKLLLERGARIDTWDKDRGTAQTVAASGGHLEVCKALLGVKGGTELLRVKDKFGYMPIHHAVFYSANEAVVRLLLENCSDVDAEVDGDRKYQKWWTPLALAFEHGVKERVEGVVTTLLDFGADPNHATKKQRTPFLLAVLSEA